MSKLHRAANPTALSLSFSLSFSTLTLPASRLSSPWLWELNAAHYPGLLDQFSSRSDCLPAANQLACRVPTGSLWHCPPSWEGSTQTQLPYDEHGSLRHRRRDKDKKMGIK